MGVAKCYYKLPLFLNERKKPPQHYPRGASRGEEHLRGRNRLAAGSAGREVAALPGELMAEWKHLHRLELEHADIASAAAPSPHPHQSQGKDVLAEQSFLPCDPVAAGERGQAAGALRGASLRIKVTVARCRKKSKKLKKRNASQMRRARPIRKKKRR